jgi:anti-sigma regulatory factor (Ser/Thr protein kinase)
MTPGIARHFVRDALQATDIEISFVETVELLTTELVTNVIVHVGSASEVVIRAEDDTVRVEVTDPADRPPQRAEPATDAPHGRGLVIVDRLADAWGVVPSPDHGKTVWFEVRTSS